MSAAAKSSKAKPGSAVTPFGAHAPSVALPLAFILTSLLALGAGTGWLLVQPELLATYHYNQNVIAVTHLFVLGWICSSVMGAMYQLVPVALETKLYSEPLARWHFVFHLVGFTGMVWMFRVWNMKQVGHFGCVLALGVGLFVYNMARTLRRVPKWNATAAAVGAALFWISLAVSAGLFIAVAKCSYDSTEGLAAGQGARALVGGLRSIAGMMSRFDAIGAMHAHAHLGGVGFFTMLIVGVSYKLIPMFALSEIQSKRRAAASIVLLNISLAGSLVMLLLRSPWKLAFALLGIISLAIYAWELAAILRVRKRQTLDWGIKYFLTAIGLLFPLSALAVALCWPALPLNVFTGQLENVYGFLGLFGVVSLAIIGMLYKIVPFLIWFSRYSSQVGRAQVPSLAELYSARVQALGYWTLLAGIGWICVAAVFSREIGVRLGCGLLAIGIATLVLNVGLMLTHLFRPKTKPFTLRTPPVPNPA
jgi:hypothetical protein